MRRRKLSAILARIACFALIAFMTAALIAPVFAAEHLDTEKSGQVTFVVRTSDKTRIGGGKIAVYKIATLTGITETPFAYLPEFAGLDININSIGMDQTYDAGTAEAIELYIKNHHLEYLGEVHEVDEYGNSVVKLDSGLYLAVQTETATGYGAFLPFLIPMPFYNEKHDSFDYILIAYPKGVEKDLEYCTVDVPSVFKTIEGSGAPADTESTWAAVCAPLPENFAFRI